ncbi:MAG: cyclically-permuted mutarotase family protein [Paludibacteraceae bacterium]
MKSEITIFSLVIILFGSCSQRSEKEVYPLKWTEVDSIPSSFGNISKGVSAAFAGLLDDKLIVAGGCNFPDIPAAEGGRKVFYKMILMFDKGHWKKIGELPYELAYGVSINLQDAMLFIGGRNNYYFSNSVYRVSMNKKTGEAGTDTLPPLPVTLDNASGAILDSIVYVFGGNQQGQPSHDMYSLDLREPDGWIKKPFTPSRSLVQPVMIAQNGALFVFGGYDIPVEVKKTQNTADTTLAAEVSQAVWRYSPENEKWENISMFPSGASLSSLSGGVGAAVADSLIITLGGVNKRIFEDALNRNYYLSKITETNRDTLTERMLSEAKTYLFQPVGWYKFTPDLYLYNVTKNTWRTLGKNTRAALAGASVTYNDKEIYVINGEIKPGVRTPKIWKITLQ